METLLIDDAIYELTTNDEKPQLLFGNFYGYFFDILLTVTAEKWST